MKNCEECGKETTNKKYCSRDCQYESYRGERRTEWVERECKYCEEKFEIKKSGLKHGKGKYCSVECCDEHKKETYKGEKNPMYGTEMSEKAKKKKRKTMVQKWKTDWRDEVMKTHRKSRKKFKEKNGCWPGHTEEAKEKRRKTMLKRHGKEHNWNGEYGERKCDKTFKEKYGKPSHIMFLEAGRKALRNKNTSIEKKVENILKKQDITFEKQKQMGEFAPDFWLPKYELVIEADGDYWHGHPEKYDELDETQKSSKKSDKRKDKYIQKQGYNIKHFWGSEIKNEDFEAKLKQVIKKYE